MATTPIHRRDDIQCGPVQIQETKSEVRIVITDFTLHAQTPCNPLSFARGVQKTITNGKPGRTYHSNAIKSFDPETGVMEFVIPFDKGLAEVVQKAEARGKKIRFFVPKDGIPIYLGKDAVEKLEALKRQGVL